MHTVWISAQILITFFSVAPWMAASNAVQTKWLKVSMLLQTILYVNGLISNQLIFAKGKQKKCRQCASGTVLFFSLVAKHFVMSTVVITFWNDITCSIIRKSAVQSTWNERTQIHRFEIIYESIKWRRQTQMARRLWQSYFRRSENFFAHTFWHQTIIIDEENSLIRCVCE